MAIAKSMAIKDEDDAFNGRGSQDRGSSNEVEDKGNFSSIE